MNTATHPPIPPKSKRFEEVGGPLAVLFHGGHSWGDYLHHPNRYAAYRDIIAAVAEVEWRKQAERWHQVWSRAADRYLADTKNQHRLRQMNRADANMEKCFDIAREWRAWGERK